MTEYMLTVHMVEGEAAPARGEMQQAYKDVDALNAEIQAAARGCSPAACTRPTPPRW